MLQHRSQLGSKLGLSVYEQDTPLSCKFGVIIDESIMIKKEKLLLALGFNADKTDGPLSHRDVVVLGMKVGENFKRSDVDDEPSRISGSLQNISLP